MPLPAEAHLNGICVYFSGVSFLLFYKRSFSGVKPKIWYLAIITLINRAGAMVLPFLSLYLTTEEGYDLVTTGNILLMFGVGSFLGNYFGGILTDRFGPFRIQLFSLWVTSLSFLVLMHLHTPLSFAMGLLVTSCLMDLFRPANMTAVSRLESAENRTKAVGVIRLAINIGFAAGPAFGGLIAFTLGYDWLFMIDAITCFLAGGLMLGLFRTQMRTEGSEQKAKKDEPKGNVKEVFKDRLFLFFLFLVFIMACVFMQIFNVIPVFFKQDMLFTEAQIGYLMAFNGVLIVFIELPLIELMKKRNELKLIASGCILLAISYLILIFDQWSVVAILCLLFFTIGEILILPYTTTAIMNRAPEHLKGRYLAFYGMAFSICHMVAPLMGMNVASAYGFSPLWWLLGSLLIVPVLGFYALRKGFVPLEE